MQLDVFPGRRCSLTSGVPPTHCSIVGKLRLLGPDVDDDDVGA